MTMTLEALHARIEALEEALANRQSPSLRLPLTICDENQQKKLTITSEPNNTALHFFNDNGDAVLSIGVDGTQAGFLNIGNATGKTVVKLDVETFAARLELLSNHSDASGIVLSGDDCDQDGGWIKVLSETGETLMDNSQLTEHPLDTPEDRKRLLDSIHPSNAQQYHALLIQLFRKEMDYRRYDEDLSYYENLYQCGFLLFHVGDVRDAEMIWEAKHINMDTGAGLDSHTLFGAGFNATIEYFKQRGNEPAVKKLSALSELTQPKELARWQQFQMDYYYPNKPTNT